MEHPPGPSVVTHSLKSWRSVIGVNQDCFAAGTSMWFLKFYTRVSSVAGEEKHTNMVPLWLRTGPPGSGEDTPKDCKLWSQPHHPPGWILSEKRLDTALEQYLFVYLCWKSRDDARLIGPLANSCPDKNEGGISLPIRKRRGGTDWAGLKSRTNSQWDLPSILSVAKSP